MRINYISRCISLLCAAAIISGSIVSVSARDEKINEDFNDSTVVAEYWTKAASGSGIKFSAEEGVLKSATSAANAGRTSGITLGSDAGNNGAAELSMDFCAANFNAAYNNSHGFSVCDKSGKKVMRILFPSSRSAKSSAAINGKTVDAISLPYRAASEWYTINAVFDFNDHTFSYKLYKQGSDVVIAESSSEAMQDSEAENIAGIEFYVNRGSSSDYVEIDNFSLADVETASINAESDSVRIGENETVPVAEVINARSVEVASSDEAVAAAEYADGIVNVTAVGTGRAAVTIKAVSPDGIETEKTIEIFAGNVELITVTVKYIYDGAEIAQSRTIPEVPTGSALSTLKIEYEDEVVTESAKYREPSVDLTGTVTEGMVIEVEYGKKINKLEAIRAVYKNGESVVAEKNVPVSDIYEGDSFTYYSPNYIKGDDGRYYVVGRDVTKDINNGYWNDTSKGVNAEIKTELTNVTAASAAEYSVSESPDVIMYDEFENLLNTEAIPGAFSNGRYWASGGAMTYTNEVKSFYEIPADGYYQILLVGAGTNRGTGIFKSPSDAAAASSYNDGILGIRYNNQYYGNYSAQTVYLAKGDDLTIRGFGTGGNTDAIDYIVVRSITTADITGPDGISVLPGTSTAEYKVETEIDDAPVWSVTGVDGVTIDANGVLTVSEASQGGTATVTASFHDGAAAAVKEVVIAKAEIADLEFNGATAINLGDSADYGIANVLDRFGNDITDYVTAVYSSDSGALKIDNATGAARAASKGTANITVNVEVNGAAASKTKSVSVDAYYITAAAAGDTTTVDVSGIIKNSNITGYTVTTADENRKEINSYEITADDFTEGTVTEYYTSEDAVVIYPLYDDGGRLLSVAAKNISAGEGFAYADNMLVWDSLENMRPVTAETRSIAADTVSVDTAGAAMVEVSPIYTFNYTEADSDYTAAKMLLPESFVDGYYDFEITKSPKKLYRCTYDLYINGAMIGNNVNEKGIGREEMEKYLTYKVNDITVKGGSIELEKEDFYNISGEVLRVDEEDRGVSQIIVKKSPTIADRKTKLYILGDSLVAIYYGTLVNGEVGTGITGWGQVFDNYLNEDIEKLDLANSGQWAKGLQETAFTCVRQDSRPGDYMILESGWNDVKYSSRAEMKQAVIEMVEECEALGVHPILVSPNVSSQTYSKGADTQYASTMRDAAREMIEKYDDVILVDLASLSYEFLKEAYNGDTSAITDNINLGHAGTSSLTGASGDNLHLSYLGAMKYAELVAQSMADQGIDFINKDFTWSCADKLGNTISVQVK